MAETEGPPYLNRGPNIAIDLRDKRKHWIYAICKSYKKGKFQLFLCAIRNPGKRLDKLREIKPKEHQWAQEMAYKLLEKLYGTIS